MRLSLAAILAFGWGCGSPADHGPSGSLDCDDPDRPLGLEWREGLPDEDGDGYGAGPVMRMCSFANLPFGWTPPGPIDCAPEDEWRWQPRPFAGRDADGDLISVAAQGEVCAGAWLPDGYDEISPAGEADCDDEDSSAWHVVSVYDDTDQDGIGVGEIMSLCIGDVFPPYGWSFETGDCAPSDPNVWIPLLHSYRDADGDGFAVPEDGEVCGGSWGFPAGYGVAPELGIDCDDADAAAYWVWSVFADADGDGVGAGLVQTICGDFDLPDGMSFSSTDCGETDPERWRVYSYSHRDGDLDSHTVAEVGSVCGGAALPAGYRTNAGSGPDCDDGAAALFRSLFGYRDVDGDGRGAGDGETFCTGGALPPGAVANPGDCAPDDGSRHTPLVGFADADGDGRGAGDAATLCTNGGLPPGFTAAGGDCAPDDGAAWLLASYAFVDRDGDGRTAAESGQVCIGASLPPPYRATASGNDCDDGDPALLGWAVFYEDGDRDGVGAGERLIDCIGESAPAELSIHGDDADDEDPVIQIDQDGEDELELILS